MEIPTLLGHKELYPSISYQKFTIVAGPFVHFLSGIRNFGGGPGGFLERGAIFEIGLERGAKKKIGRSGERRFFFRISQYFPDFAKFSRSISKKQVF